MPDPQKGGSTGRLWRSACVQADQSTGSFVGFVSFVVSDRAGASVEARQVVIAR